MWHIIKSSYGVHFAIDAPLYDNLPLLGWSSPTLHFQEPDGYTKPASEVKSEQSEVKDTSPPELPTISGEHYTICSFICHELAVFPPYF